MFSSSGFTDTLANAKARGRLLALKLIALVDLLHQVKIPYILVMDNSDVYNVCKSPFSLLIHCRLFDHTPEAALPFSYCADISALVSEATGKQINSIWGIPHQGLNFFPGPSRGSIIFLALQSLT